MFNLVKIVLFIVFVVYSVVNEIKRKMSIVIIVFLDCLQTQKKITSLDFNYVKPCLDLVQL